MLAERCEQQTYNTTAQHNHAGLIFHRNRSASNATAISRANHLLSTSMPRRTVNPTWSAHYERLAMSTHSKRILRLGIAGHHKIDKLRDTSFLCSRSPVAGNNHLSESFDRCVLRSTKKYRMPRAAESPVLP